MFYIPRFLCSPILIFHLLPQFPCTNIFPSLSSLSFSCYYLFPFFSHIGCRLYKCSDLRCRRRQLFLREVTTYKPDYKTLFQHIHLKVPLYVIFLFLFYNLAALVGHGLLICEVSRLHSDTPHSVGILWTSPSHRRLSDNTQNSHQTVITASGECKTAFLASEMQ
jgi:hypothetical protein